jgi:hypothetical protein
METRRYEIRMLDEQITLIRFYAFVVSSLLGGVAKSEQGNDDHVLSVLDFGSSQRYR